MANKPGPFEEILTAGIRANQVPARTDVAKQWYRDAAKNYNARIRQGGTRAGRIDYAKINEKKLIASDPSRLTAKAEIGSMYMYMYDPKHKDTLPYYDKFPLIFPISIKSDGFMGINLHYLPLQYRAILMDALYNLTSDKRYDAKTKLKISYDILKSASKYKYFEPCIKNYLFSHMQSNFFYVNPSEWDIALFLPLAKFAKKTQAQVWSESKKSLSSRK